MLLTMAGKSPGEGLEALLTEFEADQRDLASAEAVPDAPVALDRRDTLTASWEKRLESLDYEALDPAARIDWHLLHADLVNREADARLQRNRQAQMAPMLASLSPLVSLLADPQLERIDAEHAAEILSRAAADLKELRKKCGQGKSDAKDVKDTKDAKPDLKPDPVLAVRTAGALGSLRGSLGRWFSYYDGFQPDFEWWTRQPQSALDKELETTADFFRKDIAGLKGEENDPLVGDPIGKDALAADLLAEMIPYTPEELIGIAEKEFAWCEGEMQKAATAMGCKDGKEALAKIKDVHAAPGGQPALARAEAEKAIQFLKDKQLVTIPPLAEETWGIGMLGVDAQKSLPYAVYGRPDIKVAFAHEAMPHEGKLMAMRGNNAAFLHIVTPHELIPGHHLQSFMARRYATRRQMFSTPFLVEGWALHWEMLLWDMNYTATPQEKVGALFWRMHRCARVIVTLKFHLGQMTPAEMIDFLVDRVGHERAGATAEVRRYIGDSYGPLYQVAYMTGGLQLRSLYHQLTGPGKLSPMEFHDKVLHEGPVPIEMIRAALLKENLPKNWQPAWKFAETTP